mmetsp:Transcript_15789/g.37145  ORF Transcript_15789/g.37145 Transcript_15789/m.37145 type:complete len:395 (+) Transcript_15789:394-1578(+)
MAPTEPNLQIPQPLCQISKLAREGIDACTVLAQALSECRESLQVGRQDCLCRRLRLRQRCLQWIFFSGADLLALPLRIINALLARCLVHPLQASQVPGELLHLNLELQDARRVILFVLGHLPLRKGSGEYLELLAVFGAQLMANHMLQKRNVAHPLGLVIQQRFDQDDGVEAICTTKGAITSVDGVPDAQQAQESALQNLAAMNLFEASQDLVHSFCKRVQLSLNLPAEHDRFQALLEEWHFMESSEQPFEGIGPFKASFCIRLLQTHPLLLPDSFEQVDELLKKVCVHPLEVRFDGFKVEGVELAKEVFQRTGSLLLKHRSFDGEALPSLCRRIFVGRQPQDIFHWHGGCSQLLRLRGRRVERRHPSLQLLVAHDRQLVVPIEERALPSWTAA